MQLGEQIFNAIYGSLADGRATLSFVDGSYDCSALCSSVSEIKAADGFGNGFMSSNQVKIVKSTVFDERYPDIRACIGKNVLLTKITDSLTRTFKIESYGVLSGVITFGLGDPN